MYALKSKENDFCPAVVFVKLLLISSKTSEKEPPPKEVFLVCCDFV
jgi:hypothetical protein